MGFAPWICCLRCQVASPHVHVHMTTGNWHAKINLVASVASPWVQLGSLQGAHGPRPRLRANGGSTRLQLHLLTCIQLLAGIVLASSTHDSHDHT